MSPATQPPPSHQNRDPLFFRRTIIPILLTGGFILATAGATIFLQGPDSALGDLVPKGAGPILLVLGVVLLVFGVLNMLSVRALLQRHDPR
jgi:hypothetical protein